MLNHKFRRAVLLALAMLLALPPAWAGLYKCTDHNGRANYQDRPCQEMAQARLSSNLTNLSGKTEQRAFLWTASGDKGTLYLLGSLRFGMKSMYPLPQAVMDAYNASDVLVLGKDVKSLGMAELEAALKGRGTYADKTTLEDHVKPATWKKALEMAKRVNLGEDRLKVAKPWLAALLLSAESLRVEGYSADLGLGEVFRRENEAAKPVVELESIDQQIGWYEGLPALEQEQALLLALQELGRSPELFRDIADSWRRADGEAMYLNIRRTYDTGELSEKLYKIFVDDSNERMVAKLKELTRDGRTYFAVIGAWHLLGDKGVIRLLQDSGYKVTPP